ncbi:TIGD3 [Branchiostoma lanceolatum]|uniref:TIGD3 protein n=1 Tax=Branchiostoma lanceolatum TaxID=7740 RepID=A0A8K0A831_BRALA|nr:TIGD3 [Branchiostoma lanceolatum]
MSIATPQRKRNDLTLADKVKVIQMLDGFPKTSQTEAAKKFGCSQAQVSRAYKNRAAIFQQWGCNRNPNGKRKREGKNAEAEDALFRWYVSAKARSASVTGPILMAKAKTIAEGLGYSDFKPTDGWLGRWRRRNNLLAKQRESPNTSQQLIADCTEEDINQEEDRVATSVKTEPTDSNEDSPRPATAASQEQVYIETDGAAAEEHRDTSDVCHRHNSVDPTVEENVYHEAQSVTSVRVEPALAADDIVPSRAVPPTLSQLQESFDVIRQWMRINDFPEYSSLLAIEGKVHDFCRKTKKQKNITTFFKSNSK